MHDSYQLITAATIEAVQAIVDAPASAAMMLGGCAQLAACCVYFSWADHVGGAARPEDADLLVRMIRLLA